MGSNLVETARLRLKASKIDPSHLQHIEEFRYLSKLKHVSEKEAQSVLQGYTYHYEIGFHSNSERAS